MTFGESKSVYAVPQDSGPMALYYRKDLFEQAGIPVPKTWDEYAKAAEEIKAKGGNITNFAKGDVNQFAGLVSQAGGQWFSNSGDKWDVNLTDSASKKVADYWQGLIDKKLVNTVPSFTDQWNAAYDSGQDWTWVSAVWGAKPSRAVRPRPPASGPSPRCRSGSPVRASPPPGAVRRTSSSRAASTRPRRRSSSCG